MTSPLSTLEARLTKAAAGDEDSLKFFGVQDGFDYKCPNTWSAATSSKEDLEEALADAIVFAEAANRLHLDTAEKIARSAIQHMTHTYFCLFDKMPTEINATFCGKELAQELLTNIKEMKKAFEVLKQVNKLPSPYDPATTSTAAAANPNPPKSPSKKRKISTSSSSTEASKYRPSGTDAGSSEEWSGEEGGTTKKTSSPKKLLSPKKTSSPKKWPPLLLLLRLPVLQLPRRRQPGRLLANPKVLLTRQCQSARTIRTLRAPCQTASSVGRTCAATSMFTLKRANSPRNLSVTS